jgi:hypothetical protein
MPNGAKIIGTSRKHGPQKLHEPIAPRRWWRPQT